MSTNTTTPAGLAPEAREFIIVGQDQGTGYTLWDIAPAPTDPTRRSVVLEELGVEAMDAFGSVTLEWATTPRAAVNQLLTARRDSSGLDDYGLTPDSRTENLGAEEPLPATASETLRRALAAAGLDSETDGDLHGTWVIVDLPCGAEIWITGTRTHRVGHPATRHHGWTAHFYSTGGDSSVRRELYSSDATDLDADTTALVALVAAEARADHHGTPLPLAPHVLADIAGKVRPHLPGAQFLTIDATDGTLRAVLDADHRTLWYAPASPTGLPDTVADEVARLADLLLYPTVNGDKPGDRTPLAGHDDTCLITLPRP
ncbi:hypothetical protein ACPCSP_25525 [Streptomyces cinereoruber]|uniref:hypothetical protein n=1 Tax=Streptomyces cinereoruber TaxID=67260 RepID=UPI003C2F6FEA